MRDQLALIPALPCMGASFRRASRALTKFYDHQLRGTGVRATQFTVLQVLSHAGEVTQGLLGKMLAMESTTLTRTIEILRRRGWVAKHQGDDRRERRLHLTKSGQGQLERALPQWAKAQARLRSSLGDERWRDLTRLIDETMIVTERGRLS